MLAWIAYVSCSIILILQCYAISDEELREVLYPDNMQTEFVTKCYGDLGCFFTGPPFYDPVQRPVTVLPADNTSAKFYLYTPDNPNEKYELVPTAASLEKSRFNGNYPLKVLTHGVAQEDFSIFFKETCLKSRDIHVIAHSLGAHLAGWVGKRIKNLGRISGLDPAGVTFHGAPPSVRLDYSDAVFLDVLYTNAGRNASEGLALGEPIGRVNFYPNGGQKQPGCTSNQSKDTFEELIDSCNHNRALELYTATINSSKCQYFATECSSWKKYKRGACRQHNSMKNKMGFHSKYIPGVPSGLKFYLKTGAKYPFCNSNTRS